MKHQGEVSTNEIHVTVFQRFIIQHLVCGCWEDDHTYQEIRDGKRDEYFIGSRSTIRKGEDPQDDSVGECGQDRSSNEENTVNTSHRWSKNGHAHFTNHLCAKHVPSP